MNPRGRRHWNQTITVLVLTPGGRDPNNPTGTPLSDKWDPVPTRQNDIAFIESADRELLLKSGITSTAERWFIRTIPGARLTQQTNRIRWHSTEGTIDLAIVTVNAIPGEDIELTVTRAQ